MTKEKAKFEPGRKVWVKATVTTDCLTENGNLRIRVLQCCKLGAVVFIDPATAIDAAEVDAALALVERLHPDIGDWGTLVEQFAQAIRKWHPDCTQPDFYDFAGELGRIIHRPEPEAPGAEAEVEPRKPSCLNCGGLENCTGPHYHVYHPACWASVDQPEPPAPEPPTEPVDPLPLKSLPKLKEAAQAATAALPPADVHAAFETWHNKRWQGGASLEKKNDGTYLYASTARLFQAYVDLAGRDSATWTDEPKEGDGRYAALKDGGGDTIIVENTDTTWTYRWWAKSKQHAGSTMQGRRFLKIPDDPPKPAAVLSEEAKVRFTHCVEEHWATRPNEKVHEAKARMMTRIIAEGQDLAAAGTLTEPFGR